jgi:hypothetical protein
MGKKVIFRRCFRRAKPHYQEKAVCVVPLRASSGTRLKILGSRALGRPDVSISIGCKSLKVTQMGPYVGAL